MTQKNKFNLFLDIENEIIRQSEIYFPRTTEHQKSILLTTLIIKSGGWNSIYNTVFDMRRSGKSLHDAITHLFDLHHSYIYKSLKDSGYKFSKNSNVLL